MLVDIDLLCVEGYFEEIKFGVINVGDLVVVYLMGELCELYGCVDSIVVGINDSEWINISNLLLSVNLIFNWVCLV